MGCEQRGRGRATDGVGYRQQGGRKMGGESATGGLQGGERQGRRARCRRPGEMGGTGRYDVTVVVGLAQVLLELFDHLVRARKYGTTVSG